MLSNQESEHCPASQARMPQQTRTKCYDTSIGDLNGFFENGLVQTCLMAVILFILATSIDNISGAPKMTSKIHLFYCHIKENPRRADLLHL